MHISFLQYLCDPQTEEPLDVDITEKNGDFVLEGYLRSHTNSFPIVGGIPRFLKCDKNDDYTSSFGYQWNKWAKVQFESKNRGKPMEGWTLNMWERITSITTQNLQNALILDFGCGSGRFIEVVRMKNGRAIGIDRSSSVEVAYENFKDDKNVLILQGDVLNPPIKRGFADGVFSIGVLHHTPDPRKGFDNMVHSVKGGGWIAVSVYSKGGYYDFSTVRFYRKIFEVLQPFFKHFPPLIYAYVTTYGLSISYRIPFIGKLIRGVFPYIKLPDKKWSLLDTFDSVTPAYQSVHEPYEIFKWCKDADLIDIEPSDWGFTSYHAIKPNHE